MNPQEAEKIVKGYGGIIANKNEGDKVQSVFDLPNSPGKIRYAFFVYTEELIKEELLTDEIKNSLEQIYAVIDTQFVENADKINSAWRKYKTSEKAREFIKQNGGITAGLPSLSKMTEYHNFIVDCYGNWGESK